MTYDAILSALADQTRRAILDRLRAGPLPVVEIARDLPVSRPAVSQHLKTLLDAGLVSRRAQGTRNLYALVPGGAAALSTWLGDLRALPAEVSAPADALRRTVTTRLDRAEAWQLFCHDLATWWPVARVSHSAMTNGALPLVVTLDPTPNGALRETLFDGATHDWAQVTAATACDAITFDWRLGTPEGSVVRVAFQSENGGARVTLHHDQSTDAIRDMWEIVLDRFAAAANSSLSNF